MAKQGTYTVSLIRDGHDQPWGFRMQGGFDHSKPLQVQRVFIGSPSENVLHRGDTILKIGSHDATKLTHQEAHDFMTHTGNSINLTVHRSGDPVPNTPSPIPELSVLISEAAHAGSAPLSSPTPTGLPYHQVLQKPVDLLPVSKIKEPTRQFPSGLTNHPEVFEGELTKIHKQPYRTTPLITPSLKTNRDLPTGTYMRFHPDPKVRGTQTTTMKDKDGLHFTTTGWNPSQQVFGAVTSAASQQQQKQQYRPMLQPSKSYQAPTPQIYQPNVRLPHDEEKEVVHMQYNSPMELYSQENIANTMEEQTGLTPAKARVVFKGAAHKPIPKVTPASRLKSDTKPGGPIIYSPSKSPTFNAVADDEWGNLHKKTFDEKRPPAHKIKTVPASLEHHPLGTEKIAQSYSFMRVMQEVGM